MTLALKIHRGFHSGASAPLGDGEFTIGSSDECDFILSDPGVQPHHMRLRVAGAECFCLVYDGGDAFIDNVEIGADETPVPPFAVVSLGSAAFRIGPDSAEWPPLPEGEASEPPPEKAAPAAGGASQKTAGSVPPRKIAGGKSGRWPLLITLGLIVLLFLAALRWFFSAGAVNRLRHAAELLEARGFSIAAEGSPPSKSALALSADDDAIVVSGAVDFSRHIRQIEDALREGGFTPRPELVARDDNLRQAEEWLRDNDIPMQIRMLGKTRAAIAGYAENTEDALAVVDAVQPLMSGFESVGNEIVLWPAFRRILDDVMTKRGLAGLGLAPARYHVVVTGMLADEEQIKSWRDAETELNARLRFQPRFEWRRPPSEYLRLVRRALEERRIPFAANLRGQNVIMVAGYARDADIAAYGMRQVSPIVAEWPGGEIATEFTFWEEAEPILRRLLRDNSFDDVQVIDVGDFAVTLLGDVSQPERADRWVRVATDFAAELAHAPEIKWRRPPPPENAWLSKTIADLGRMGFQPVEAGDDAGAPSVLNVAKSRGAIKIFGAVETADERLRLLEYADKSAFSVATEVVSRQEVLERVQRLLADRGAVVPFERVPGNRLRLYGFVKDVDTGRRFLGELTPLLDCFVEVEERFTTWAEVKDAFGRVLDHAGLEEALVEALDHGVRVEGDASVEKTPQWRDGMLEIAGRIGAVVPVVWAAPPPPAEARPADVVKRLRDLGMEPVLLEPGDAPKPFTLTVRPDGRRILISGVVESTADKNRVLGLIDEGMLHLTVDLAVRGESIRQAERFLTELDIAVLLKRVGSNRIVIEGYALDLVAGDLLLQEMRRMLPEFVAVDADLTYWTEVRQPLANLLPRYGLERLAIYPGEYEIHAVGSLAPEEEAKWRSLLAALEKGMSGPLPIQWSGTLPVIRRGRLARRLGLEDGNASGLIPEDNPAMLPVDLTGAIAQARAEEEARQAAINEEKLIAEESDYRMQVTEVVTLRNGSRKIRIAGSERLFAEGELFRGYLIIEIFGNGVMMMKGGDMVIYTVEAPEDAAQIDAPRPYAAPGAPPASATVLEPLPVLPPMPPSTGL